MFSKMGYTRCQLIWAYLILATGCVTARSIQFENTCKTDVKLSENNGHVSLFELIMGFAEHEYECCPGYEGFIDDCQPICSKECGANSYCRSPEICDCLEGYLLNEEGVCWPVCSTDCGDNGYCKWPEICVCFDDYEKVEGGGCELHKDQHLCTENVIADNTEEEFMSYEESSEDKSAHSMQNRQVCCEGYERMSETEPCVPKVDPNLCTKLLQVKMDFSDHGEWIRLALAAETGSFTMPESKTEVRRVCCDGYKWQMENNKCKQIKLKNESEEEHCANDKVEVTQSPEWRIIEEAFDHLNIKFPSDMFTRSETVEICSEGYERKTESDLCQPVCNPKCGENSICEEGNQCVCVEGFEISESGDCVSTFTDLIVNPVEDTTKDPNLCKSDQVDEKLIPFQSFWYQPSFANLRLVLLKEEFCCEGYERKTDAHLCQPVCQPDCGANSYCKKPNTCECQNNYHMGVEGQCVRDLKADDPHVCRRNKNLIYAVSLQNIGRTEVELYCCDGYEQEVISNRCLPKCSKGCAHNCRCVQPEVCECQKDSQQKDDSSSPSIGCCGPHSYCQCETGFVKGTSGLCEPLCAAGCPAHSRCTRRGHCECHEGYTNSSSNCQPICLEAGPEHSSCMRPGEWECDLGYIKLPSEDELGYSCQPHCKQSCSTYGNCVAPDVCECLPGYRTLIIGFDIDQFVEACQPALDDEASTTEKQATENSYKIMSYNEYSNDAKIMYRTV